MIRNHMRRGMLASLTTLALGCAGDKGVLPAKVAAANALGRMAASPHNAIVAVGGTVQLSVAAVALTGEPIVRFDSVRYSLASLADSARVRVSTDGLITGVSPTVTAIEVNAYALLNGTIQGDQVLVQITAAAVPGLTLSIQPPPGDSTKLANGTAKTILPLVRNPTTGVSVAGVQLQYQVNPTDENRMGVYIDNITFPAPSFGTLRVGRVALTPTVGRNQIVPYVGEGTAWVYARLNAYGTLLQDSVLYTCTYPYTSTVATRKNNLALETSLNGGSGLPSGGTGSLTLAPGAVITFSNGVASTDPLTLAYTFDNPAAAPAPAVSPSITGGSSGNVTALTGGQSSRRQFLTPGTYHWTTVAAGGPAPWPGQAFYGTIVIK